MLTTREEEKWVPRDGRRFQNRVVTEEVKQSLGTDLFRVIQITWIGGWNSGIAFRRHPSIFFITFFSLVVQVFWCSNAARVLLHAENVWATLIYSWRRRDYMVNAFPSVLNQVRETALLPSVSKSFAFASTASKAERI